MLTKIKMALRISHNQLDSHINSLIDTARAEMIRSGVNEDMADSESDPLIIQAVNTYVLSVMASDPKLMENYEKSWLYQLDNLRKSEYYRGGSDV